MNLQTLSSLKKKSPGIMLPDPSRSTWHIINTWLICIELRWKWRENLITQSPFLSEQLSADKKEVI